MEGGPSEERIETPTISYADYINRLEVFDAIYDPHRSGENKTMTEEFYGEAEGWENENNRFIHEIHSVQRCIRMITSAALDENGENSKKFINAPEDVDHYELWLSFLRQIEKIYINTRDRNMVNEIHRSFLEVIMCKQASVDMTNWLLGESRYAKMKSPLDPTMPLVDTMPMSARRKARSF